MPTLFLRWKVQGWTQRQSCLGKWVSWCGIEAGIGKNAQRPKSGKNHKNPEEQSVGHHSNILPVLLQLRARRKKRTEDEKQSTKRGWWWKRRGLKNTQTEARKVTENSGTTVYSYIIINDLQPHNLSRPGAALRCKWWPPRRSWALEEEWGNDWGRRWTSSDWCTDRQAGICTAGNEEGILLLIYYHWFIEHAWHYFVCELFINVRHVYLH